jgi:glycosyltransferase involved in cell wall biosynthesis
MNVGLSTSVVQRGKTGIAQYVFSLTRALLDLPDGPDLTLFVLAEDRPLFAFAEGRAHIEIVDEEFRPPVRNIMWHQTILPRRVRALGLDVLHVPSYRRLVWSKPCPTVATIHDLAPFHVTGKYDRKRMFYGRTVVRHLAARQDEIIAISANTGSDVARFFHVSPEQITVIHNGLDHGRFNTSVDESAASATVQRHRLDRPFFLYVSRLEHPGKNHVRLIEAFNRFKTTTQSPWLLVLGGSDWHGAEAIHEAARQSPFVDDIRLTGFVSDDELPALYRSAGAVVYPSLYEGFGLPPVEAMACGCPVLTTHRGALAEIVGDAAAIVDPEDTAAMAFELERLTNDRFWRAYLIEAGLQRAARFSWHKCARATFRVYQRAGGCYAPVAAPIRKLESTAWIS